MKVMGFISFRPSQARVANARQRGRIIPDRNWTENAKGKQMIDWFKKHKETLSGIGIALVFAYWIGVLFYSSFYVPEQLRIHGRYTVATTGEMYFVAKGGRKVKFFFSVNGKQYEDRWGKMDFIVPNGEKYLIKYSAKNPNINERVYDYPVPAEFRTPPDNGWSKLPY